MIPTMRLMWMTMAIWMTMMLTTRLGLPFARRPLYSSRIIWSRLYDEWDKGQRLSWRKLQIRNTDGEHTCIPYKLYYKYTTKRKKKVKEALIKMKNSCVSLYKTGIFFNAYGDDGIILHHLVGYKYLKPKNSVGFQGFIIWNIW